MDSRERFWQLSTRDEMVFVNDLLRRRFPRTYDAISSALEEADPMDLVYPGNPGEYNGVVREAIALLAPVNGDLGRLDRAQLDELVRTALARYIGEPPDEDRLKTALDLMTSRYKASP